MLTVIEASEKRGEGLENLVQISVPQRCNGFGLGDQGQLGIVPA